VGRPLTIKVLFKVPESVGSIVIAEVDAVARLPVILGYSLHEELFVRLPCSDLKSLKF